MAAARRRLSVGLGLAGAACALLGVCLLLVGPVIIKEQVVKNVRIDPTSISFSMWKDIPVPFYMSVYLFEVLNPKEALQGAKPVLNQRGPYVYREYRYKTNITFHDNDTVSFLEYRQLFFQPDMSNGSEEEYVVVPNILMMGAAVMMENLPNFVKLLLSGALAGLKQEAFMNRTVGEILWGYDDPLIDTINTLVPGLLPFKGKFGLFMEFNNSNSGLFTVYTGMKNISRVHMVDSWNGLKKVNYWRSNECNMINGTAGEMWPPFMSPTSLEFYSPDACRSLTLVYEQSGKFEGVPTYRFVAPKTLFANGTDYPPNEGFCPCMQSGIQNVSTCRLNDRHPHELLHQAPAEPVHKACVWYNSGSIEGSVLKQFYTNLVLIPSLLDYVQYIFLGLSVPLIISAAVLMARSQGTAAEKSPRHPTTQSKPPPSSETTPLLHDAGTLSQDDAEA
ncbi:scavenger receptor class b member 1 [Limosa lapponica baueri]|uniref:Scavenger receptor class B member 1 n=1 Tax=Limosa lapponica baueri TaxID=1758121 RepID=A0A2I0TNK8_LIMLA|nr:scavenger receptor class b member 1 [Limosa lapponica baueri]